VKDVSGIRPFSSIKMGKTKEWGKNSNHTPERQVSKLMPERRGAKREEDPRTEKGKNQKLKSDHQTGKLRGCDRTKQ